MSIPLPQYNPPPMTFHRQPKDFKELRKSAWDMGTYLEFLQSTHVNYFQQIANSYNNSSQGFGADIVAASTIQPTSTIHVITGTGTIQTIAFPPNFNGALYLISQNGFSTTTGGNIAQAIVAPATALVTLVYVPQRSLFYVTSVSIPDGSITTSKLAPGAASASGSVTDNTVQVIGTSDTGVASFTVTVIAASDFILLHGRTIFTITNYTTGAPTNVVTKLWRGPVTTGTVVDSSTTNLSSSSAATLAGASSVAFNFFDTGVSGATTYNLSISSQAGPTLTKTSCVAWATDLRAQ